MAVNISLTIDTAQAKQALQDINSSITQIKINGNDVSIGGKKISQQMQQVGNAAQQAGAQTQRASQQVTNSVINQVRTVTQSFDKGIANVAKNFFSVWSVIILGVQMATKAFTYFFENLTENIDKMTVRGNTAIKMAQRMQTEAEKKVKTSKDLVNQLIKLNQMQSLSIDQQRLGESITNRLNKQYKDLGITLDETTGKYKGVYQALVKLEQRQNSIQASSLRKQIQAQREVVNASLVKTFGRGISLDQTVKGEDFFSVAEQMGATLGAQNADLLAKKWNTGILQKQIEVVQQLIDGLSTSNTVMQNSPEALDALNRLKDLRDELKALNSADKLIEDANRRLAESFKQQADAIKKAKDQLEKLKQNYQDQQRANSLAGLDPEDRANAIRGEVEQLEKRNQVLQKAIEYGQKQATGKRQNSKQALKWLEEYQNGMRQAEQAMNSTQKQMQKTAELRARDEGKAQELFKQYRGFPSMKYQQTDAYKEYTQLLAQVEEYRKKQKELSAQLNSEQKQFNGFKKAATDLEIEYEKQNGITLQHEQAIANLENERQQNLNKIQQKEKQIADITKQVEQAKRKAEQAEAERLKKQQEAVDNITANYQKQLEAFNKTDLQKKIDDALQRAQKAKGADLTQDEVDAIKFYVTQLQKMNQLEAERAKTKQQADAIEGVFKGYETDQTLAYMKLIGQEKEAILLQAQLNAQRAKGAKLTEEELESLKNYVDVQQMIDDATNAPNISLNSNGVITNQLAAKGGFASSVVTDRAQDINKEILSQTKKQTGISTEIRNAIEKYSVIQ